eukprot:TRINITY_DN6018_c0_g1_i1.p1 TRINITY_DN6018_c0_g1~~TRINITY_DN6018_c0_g1_i1.p1  ORF type:complete len:420 (+),score=46.08 TRINITY_DN6018_c0_g1_i1:98-1261(+)
MCIRDSRETLRHAMQLLVSTPAQCSNPSDGDRSCSQKRTETVDVDSWLDVASFSVDELLLEDGHADSDEESLRSDVAPLGTPTRKRSFESIECLQEQRAQEAPKLARTVPAVAKSEPMTNEVAKAAPISAVETRPVETTATAPLTAVAGGREVLHAERLVQMSFDAMAHVCCHSGAVIWTNNAFNNLVSAVGHGNSGLGLQTLRVQFLQHLPRGMCSKFGTVSVDSGSIELWSATQVAGDQGQEVVLWSVQCPTDHASRAKLCRAPKAVGPVHDQKPFPRAVDYTDIKCEIQREGPTKRGCLVQMLWRKYGQKKLLPPPVIEGSGPPHVLLNRLYFKCTQQGCDAKMRVDAARETGDFVCVSASGVHNHHIVLYSRKDDDTGGWSAR